MQLKPETTKQVRRQRWKHEQTWITHSSVQPKNEQPSDKCIRVSISLPKWQNDEMLKLAVLPMATVILILKMTQVLTCQIELTPGTHIDIGKEATSLGMHVSNTQLIQRLAVMLDIKQRVTVERRCSSSNPHSTTILWTTDDKASESAPPQWLTRTLLSQMKWFWTQKVSKSYWNRARPLVCRNKPVACRFFPKRKTWGMLIVSLQLCLTEPAEWNPVFHRSSMLSFAEES